MFPSYVRTNSNHERTIVVGDIHGCYEELLILLDTVGFAQEDVLVAVGDIIDRGPNVNDLIRFFRETSNAHTVLGNHERRVAGVIRKTSKPAWTQEQTLSRIALPKEVIANYFETLPAVIETNHAVITHARLDPCKSIYDQEPRYTAGVGGKSVYIDRDNYDVPKWFCQIMEQVDIPICIGHLSYRNVELVPEKLFALDTKAVKGHFLTAVIFPGAEIIQIPVSSNYYELSKREWGLHELSEITTAEIKVYKYLQLQATEQKSALEQAIVNQCDEFIEQANILVKLQKIQSTLRKKHIEILINHSEKKKFIDNLAKQHDSLDRWLIYNSLFKKELTTQMLLKQLQGENLEKIVNVLDQFERKIDK